ncbi:MAG: DnaJ domain-containing protein [Deltaproteobacteria bacterium]|nr:DnaJ domain-containing protein [Deltaproteobacteria bacterium]
MDSQVPADIEGNLGGYPLPRLLYLLLKRVFLGRLELRTEAKTISIYFRGGLPTFTDAYMPEAVLSQVLLERGLLNQKQLNKSLALLAQGKLLHGKILRTLGVIDQSQLADALCLQLRRKLYNLFTLPTETSFALYSGEHSHGRVDEAALVRADSLFVIYNGIRNSYTLPRLEQELSQLGERKAALHPQFDRIKKRFDFRDDEEQVLALLERDACSVQHLLTASNLSPTHTHMLLYTLWVCEVLLPEGPAATHQPKPEPTSLKTNARRSPETVEGLPSVARLAQSFGDKKSDFDLPPPRNSDNQISPPEAKREAILLPPTSSEDVVLTPPHVTGDYPAIELPPPSPKVSPSTNNVAPVLVMSPSGDDLAPVLVMSPDGDNPPPVLVMSPSEDDLAHVLVTPLTDDMAPVLVTPPVDDTVPSLAAMPLGDDTAPILAPMPGNERLPGARAKKVTPTPTPVARSSARQKMGKLARAAEQEAAPEEHRKLILKTWEEMQGQTLFQLLSVSPDATADEIKEAYFKRAKRFHPDRVTGLGVSDVAAKAAQIFQRLNDANMTLSDARKREAYIQELETGVSSEQQESEVRQAMEAEFAFQKGMVFFRKRAFHEATKEFQAAYEFSPEEGEHEGWFAWALFCDPKTRREEELPRIRQHLQHAVRIAAKSADCQYFLGEVHLFAGDENRALGAFKLALEVKPNLDSQRQIRLIHMRREKASKEKKRSP